MRAVQVERFGGPEVLEAAALADPVPATGQVGIEVAFAGVTFVETQLRAGRPPSATMMPALPMVPGNGVGGTVRALGPDTDPALLGCRVVASLGGRGGYAQRAVADQRAVVPIPDAVATDEATALLADGRTARALLEAVGAITALEGRTVLVAPAAGGVGSLLVPLLVRVGAHVVAAAGGARKVEIATSRGAHVGVDYRDVGWVGRVRRQVGEVDVVLDGVGGDVGDRALSLLGRDGVVCRFGAAAGRFAASPAKADRTDVRPVSIGVLEPGRQTRLVTEALADAAGDGVRPLIGQRFALEDAAASHAALESRATVGKTLLEIR